MEKKLTTAQGQPVDNDQASQSTGPQGYTLLQDIHLIEKLAHFDRERIPERVVHAKGAGAHGTFEVIRPMTEYTCAEFLSKAGKKTDVFVRFSTVGGERGSADSERDPRGFAVKFYTGDGNYDLVGNNTPIFFIRDAIKFPDFIHTQKRNPKTNLKDPNAMWDFWSLTPESLHQVAILFSDRGTPASYRNMHGFGSHTYMWYNEKKDYVWVKYHWVCDQPIKNLTGPEADAMRGTDPDHATRDLYEAVSRGEFPSWTLKVQIMTPEQAEQFKFNPFDVTKVWYHKDFPLIPIGKMTLNKNPENYFAEVEQVAFAPSNTVSGVAPSPDKLLQGRLFSYTDTQRHRLGTNFTQIPINAPKSPMAHYQRDGAMNIDGNGGPGPVYYPNSMGGPAPAGDRAAPPRIDLRGVLARHEQEVEELDFEQPGLLYSKVLSETDRAHLCDNLCASLGGALERLQYREAALFTLADTSWGREMAARLSLDFDRVVKLSQVSQAERLAATGE
jgi:catalase